LVGNGTDAIYLTLRANGIKSGMNVVVPAISAIPTAAAVKMVGANPVYVDVEKDTCLIDLNELDRTLEDRLIDAVIIVHLYGNVVNSFKAKEICNKHNVPLIEDCAQAFDCFVSKDKERKFVGTIGNAGAFSCYPSKTLNAAGDTGFVVSDNVKVIQKIKELRFYGQVDRYVMGDESGINSRSDEIQCAILLKKLKFLDELNKRREILFEKYNNNFKNKVKFNCEFAKCNPHLFPIFVKNRKKFMRLMSDIGIETLVHYPFTLPAVMDNEIKTYANAEYISNNIVSIPFNVWMSDEEISYVIEKVNDLE
jgi:dTDP-4-amino-4,6-dideoxygalactose transaminase